MDPTTLKLTGAALLAIFGGVMWFAFIRKVPEQTALATIVSKGDVAAGSHVQQRTGPGGAPSTPNVIQLAPANSFELRIDGRADPVRASFNTTKSRAFEPGQRVRVQYVIRGLPPLWQRVTVTEMTPADSQ
jgi:hypothetical protein